MVARYDSASLARKSTDAANGEISGQCRALILVADDSESDRFFLTRAFKASGIANPVQLIDSGAELLRYLAGEGKYRNRDTYPLPRIVFIDLQMPVPNGFEVLQWKQKESNLPRILWVAMSNFNSVKTINDAYSAGASTFLTKPLDGADIKNLVESFEEFWIRTGCA